MIRLSEHVKGVALVDVSITEAADALASILARYGPVKRSALADWGTVKEFLLPLKSFPTRYTLIPFSRWTAILCDMNVEMCHVDALAISKQTGSRAVSAYFKETTRHFHAIESGRSFRDITCYDDNGEWVFFESGAPASWEAVEAYARRRVQDRLTPDMVLAYLQAATGIAFPLDWQGISAGAVGLERSIRDLKVPVQLWEVQADI